VLHPANPVASPPSIASVISVPGIGAPPLRDVSIQLVSYKRDCPPFWPHAIDAKARAIITSSATSNFLFSAIPHQVLSGHDWRLRACFLAPWCVATIAIIVPCCWLAVPKEVGAASVPARAVPERRFEWGLFSPPSALAEKSCLFLPHALDLQNVLAWPRHGSTTSDCPFPAASVCRHLSQFSIRPLAAMAGSLPCTQWYHWSVAYLVSRAVKNGRKMVLPVAVIWASMTDD
jgi:hypothetical protein